VRDRCNPIPKGQCWPVHCLASRTGSGRASTRRGVTQREVEIVVGMVLALIGIVLLPEVWPDAPVREMLGV
jgi:hypothetical protein